jgi:hypothetical protein
VVGEIVVGRIGRGSAGVADARADDRGVTPEPGVGSPESTEAERGGFDEARRVKIEREHHDQSTRSTASGYTVDECGVVCKILKPSWLLMRDERSRDVHFLDGDGMVACNPRDREAAHRADVGDIVTTTTPAAVTCRKCRAALTA